MSMEKGEHLTTERKDSPHEIHCTCPSRTCSLLLWAALYRPQLHLQAPPLTLQLNAAISLSCRRSCSTHAFIATRLATERPILRKCLSKQGPDSRSVRLNSWVAIASTHQTSVKRPAIKTALFAPTQPMPAELLIGIACQSAPMALTLLTLWKSL